MLAQRNWSGAGALMVLRSWLRRGLVYIVPLAVLLLALGARIAAPDRLDRLMLISFDLYQRIAPRPSTDSPVRIADIDNDSLKQFGQWPWPRSLDAELVDKLRAAGASIVAFDIVFSEPDRTSPKLLLDGLKQRGEVNSETVQLLSALPDPDAQLVAAIKAVPTVIGFILSEHGDTAKPLAKAGFAFAGSEPLGHVDGFPAAINNLPELQQAAAGNGFLNRFVDWDEIVRRVPLVMRLGDKPVPSLAAEILRVRAGSRVRTYVGKAAGASGETAFGQHTGLNNLRIGDIVIPTDPAGRVWLYYARPSRANYISAAKILSGDFDPALVKDRVVLIGTSANGVVNDTQATPLATHMPGVEIHAQLIDQILQGVYLTRPDWAQGTELIFTIAVCLALIVALPRIGALASGLVGFLGIAVALAASWLAFFDFRLLLDPVYPTAVVMLVYFTSSVLVYLRTEMRHQEVRGMFSRYMSPHYVDVLAKNPEKLVLGGEARVLTVMFCDIRGFTSLSEGMSAHDLTHLMNRFTSPMTDTITEYKGTIDKYIGDCIMAFWNAPLDDPDHARNAVMAAREMRRKLTALNRELEAEAKAENRPFHEIRFGIGLNSGECVVGNFGSEQRFNYSLLGDPVNLASRVEGLGKLYTVDLVIAEDTAKMIDDPDLIELDLVAVKGKSQAVKVFTLPPEGEDEAPYKSQHAELIAAYRKQDWRGALATLGEAPLSTVGYLAPVYTLYRHRIAHFQAEAPPSGWDGVYTAEEK
jgi:adenylate cyclase